MTVWLLSVLVLLISRQSEPSSPPGASRIAFFAAFHEKVRKEFSCQSEDTFNTLMTGTNRVLRKNNEEPTVFLVLAPGGALPAAIRLVTLLVHCTLIAFQHPCSRQHVAHILTDSSEFTAHSEEWLLYKHVRKQLKFYGVSAITGFENLHPHMVRTLRALTHSIVPPFPESVLILVVDVKDRFTEYQQKNMPPNSLGRIFLQDHLEPYFDQEELRHTVNQIGSRCVIVNPEPDNL